MLRPVDVWFPFRNNYGDSYRTTLLKAVEKLPERAQHELFLSDTFQAGLDKLDENLPCYEQEESVRKLLAGGMLMLLNTVEAYIHPKS